MSETISGKIIDAGPEGLTIRAPYSDWQRFVLRRYEDVQVLLCDGRQLTPKQSRAIHAMVHDIARWQSGFAYRDRVFHETLCALQLQYIIDTTDSEEVRYSLTQRFCDLMDIPIFSLSPKNENCADMTTAREFLGWLIDLCVAYDIPTSGPLTERAEDVSRYLYACLAHRRCAVCGLAGGPADLHHVTRVGMGRSRKRIAHIGMLAESLCRTHHQEADQIGQAAFDEKYHIYGIPLDERLCAIHGLAADNRDTHEGAENART